MATNENIIPSLFGLTPDTYQQQRALQLAAEQQKIASAAAGPGTMLNPSLQPLYAQAAQRGQMAGTALGGIFGMEDPQLKMVRDVTQMRQGFDTTTPEGLQSFAQALAAKGYTDLSVQAMDKANQLMKTGAEAQTAQQKISQEKKLREELNALGENATDEDVLKVVRKFGTPDQVMKAVQASLDKKNALLMKQAAEGGTGAGPVGKTGAYRDIDGTVFGAAEMKPIRTEFSEGQKLLKMLNDVTGQDIKDAESYADWTTAGVTKGLASSKTLTAQTKIAAAQLIEQINNLPPGSASDADMRAAMKSFPGYSDPESLRLWVNRTKAKLQSRLEDISGQFNFNQRVKSSGDVTFSKGKGKAPVNLDSNTAQPSAGGVINLDKPL
jgi:hypothetical protein